MLNCTLQKAELREALRGISKVVAGKCTLPVLGCVRFVASDGCLVAQATDLDQMVEYRFGAPQVSGAGACIIPIGILKDLAKGGKDEQIEIEVGDRITLINHVGGHAVRQRVAGMELDEWPHVTTDISTKPADGFIDTYRRLAPFSSTDETRHILNSVYVEVGKGLKPVTMVATDGRRLASVNSMVLPLTESIVVPVTRFLSWTRLPGDVEIGIRKDDELAWLGTKAGPFFYATKTIEGIYPNYRQVIPSQPGNHRITFEDSDVVLLKTVLPTFPGNDEITVVGSAGKVTLYGRESDDDKWTTLALENTGYTGERAFVGLNRYFLLDALAAGFREFAVTDELTPVLSRDGNGGTHVLMPMRVDDPEQTEVTATNGENDTSPKEDKPMDVAPQRNASEHPVEKSRTREKTTMTKPNEHKSEAPALSRILGACIQARTKVKEAGQALTELTSAIKAAEREQKGQGREVEQARAALAKLQSITL